jgi:2-polyprenyl-3-methyl-5-hydroxy-6-metoxy-1,4-benzoquinol methylase
VQDPELQAAIQEVRQRVTARRNAALALPDLMPLIHARDAAEAKVAAIGTVNPRQPGLLSSVIQTWKRFLARVLDWHVREQVEFNRASMAATQATIEALNETNRALGVLSNQLQDYARQVQDHRSDHEIYTLRAIAELQGSFKVKLSEIQQSLDNARAEHEKLIHWELRTIRQRSAAPLSQPTPTEPTPTEPTPTEPTPTTRAMPSSIDWLRFAERFRGPESIVLEHQRRYIPRFTGTTNILDLGCGRGEFLQAAKEAGLLATGVEAHPEFVALCQAKGLDAKCADMFAFLDSQADQSLGGVFCSHVVEHVEAAQLPALIHLIGRKAKPSAPVVFETPNAESAAIFTTHFYLDPTHVRPVPAALLRFYLEEAGFGSVEVEHLAPEMLDCAVYARKL